jgi:hypothetical protein
MLKARPSASQKGLVSVDTSKLRAALLATMLTPDDSRKILEGTASAARANWIKLAKSELKSTSRDYVQGIQEVEYKKTVARIDLLGVLPNMVEQGWPATDLRTTLLGPGAKNVKTAKDGSRYNTVPFRHGAPGGGGRNVGAPMPKPIHAEAKKLAPTLSMPSIGGGGPTVLYGGRLVPTKNMKQAARDILDTKKQPWHTTSIYTGMIRQEKMYGKAKQNTYSTFRRISSKATGDSRKWMHPGITARRLADRVSRELGAVFAKLLDQVMKSKKVPR